MLLFLLILLALAAAAGVLGAVLEATLVLVLSFVLAVVILAWIGTWYVKRRLRAYRRQVQAHVDRVTRRRTALDVGGSRLPEGDRPSG